MYSFVFIVCLGMHLGRPLGPKYVLYSYWTRWDDALLPQRRTALKSLGFLGVVV